MDFFKLGMLVALGLIAHLFGKMRELRKTEKTMTFRKHFAAHPYQIGYSIVSATAASSAMYQYGELTPITAVGIGYMADSIMDKISNRTAMALR